MHTQAPTGPALAGAPALTAVKSLDNWEEAVEAERHARAQVAAEKYYAKVKVRKAREDIVPPDYCMVFLNHTTVSNQGALKNIEWDWSTLGADEDKPRPELKYDRHRRTIVGSLRRVGLEVKQMKSMDEETILVKIWAPDWALERHAQTMRLKAHLKPVPSLEKEGHFEDAGYAVYETRFRDKFVPFAGVDRIKILYDLMRKSREQQGAGVPIDVLIAQGKMVSCFPVHDETQLDLLWKHWAMSWGSVQPLQAIRNYFGEQIGLYFAFFGFYTSWLAFPAIAGLVVFVFGLAGGGLDNRLVPIYAVVLAMWATLLLEFWKRYNAHLSFTWGMVGFQEIEETRAAFKGELQPGFWTPAGFIALDPEDYDEEERKKIPYAVYYPPWKITLKSITGFSVLLLGVGVVLLATLALLFLRYWLSFWIDGDPASPNFNPNAFQWGKTIGGVINGAAIAGFNVVFKLMAIVLNNWENYRTESAYTNNLVIKIFLFQSVNSYFTLFYIAFFKENAVIFGVEDSCQPDCMTELTYQLATILITGQVLGQIAQVLAPIVKMRLRRVAQQVAVRRFRSRMAAEGRKPVSTSLTYVEKQNQLEPFEGIVFEYMPKMIQFGYIALFASAFPIGALLALLNNLSYLRSNAVKMIKAIQRPKYIGAETIGSFYTILQILSYLAVISNVVIIALTSNQLESYVSGIDTAGKLRAILILEHGVLFFKIIISFTIPDTPSYIAKAIARQKYQQDLILVDNEAGPAEWSATPVGSDVDAYAEDLDMPDVEPVDVDKAAAGDANNQPPANGPQQRPAVQPATLKE